jgi:hypothetical protein
MSSSTENSNVVENTIHINVVENTTPINTTLEKKIPIDSGRKYYRCTTESQHRPENPSVFCKLLSHGDVVPNDSELHSFPDYTPNWLIPYRLRMQMSLRVRAEISELTPADTLNVKQVVW